MGISVIGGSSGGGAIGGNGFSLLVGATGNTTYAFETPQPAGAYSITSQLNDTTFDIYLITTENQNAGYTNTLALEATAEFDRIVLYGATTNDILNFEYKPSNSPTTSGDVVDGAAPFLTSATPRTLREIDDTTTITGGNFADDVTVSFLGSDAVLRPAKNIVRSSSTSLIVTRPDTMPEDYYDLIVENPSIENPSTNVNKLTDYIDVGFTLNIEYLVVAGGGASGFNGYDNAGGGAGGYRSSVSGENSGGLTSAEAPLTLDIGPGYSYLVTVGAGGSITADVGNSGSNSVFHTVTSLGGGGGAPYLGGGSSLVGGSGGSGGGGTRSANSFGTGTAGQGFNGGLGAGNRGGGGGGAGAVGGNATDNGSAGAGGAGLASSITGSSITRARGGTGNNSGGTAAANTGNGGGSGGQFGNGNAGGSGIVILRYPSARTITIGAGLTGSTTTVGGNRVTTITAGTGNVSWSI